MWGPQGPHICVGGVRPARRAARSGRGPVFFILKLKIMKLGTESAKFDEVYHDFKTICGSQAEVQDLPSKREVWRLCEHLNSVHVLKFPFGGTKVKNNRFAELKLEMSVYDLAFEV